MAWQDSKLVKLILPDAPQIKMLLLHRNSSIDTEMAHMYDLHAPKEYILYSRRMQQERSPDAQV